MRRESNYFQIGLTAFAVVAAILLFYDTLFGGKLPAPTATTLRALQNYVLDKNCDIGIATDGDADRIGVIDDRGRFLHPQRYPGAVILLSCKVQKLEGAGGPQYLHYSHPGQTGGEVRGKLL